MKVTDRAVRSLDRWQRGHRAPSVLVGVAKKFGDDQANQFVVSLGWYGFVAIFPLLLAVTTVLGAIGAATLGTRVVSTLHQFPIIGTQFQPGHGPSSLHRNVLGLVIGVLGLVYGALGVTQTLQQAMVRVWNIPQVEVPGYLPRVLRSLGGLALIGFAYLVNGALAAVATGGQRIVVVRMAVIVVMAVFNTGCYVAVFRVLTPRVLPLRALVPGGAVAGLGFTILITLGSGLVQHQLRNTSATYGQFGLVIGLVGFLFLVAKITLYGAELNPVLRRHLWPRGLDTSDPTQADDHVLRDLAEGDRRRNDQRIAVSFDQEGSDTAGGTDDQATVRDRPVDVGTAGGSP